VTKKKWGSVRGSKGAEVRHEAAIEGNVKGKRGKEVRPRDNRKEKKKLFKIGKATGRQLFGGGGELYDGGGA